MWIFDLVACGPIERLAVEVEVGEVPVISWNRGPAHEVFVVACEEECRNPCLAEGYLGLSGPVVWSVGYDAAWTFEQAATQEPTIDSPLEYGQAEVAGDARQVPAEPLRPGVVYGVQVQRLLPCDPNGEGCPQFEALGCSSFEVGS